LIFLNTSRAQTEGGREEIHMETVGYKGDDLVREETRASRITLTLLEETPSGPYWDVKVEGDKNFSLFSDELVLNMGHKRPAVKFTSEGMTTICPMCGCEVCYGVQENFPSWWCEECGHRRRPSI